MSRVGKKPIELPENVEVKIEDSKVFIKGPKGELSREIPEELSVEITDGKIFVRPKERIDSKKTKSLWGLIRVLLQNMAIGVSRGFEKKLQIEGVGYRAAQEGENLSLQIGFSHKVLVKKPPGINFSIEKNIIAISGIDKELVGQTAANIRKLKKPEPYKGKGIRYVGEIVRKKMGKKAVGSGVK